MLSAKLFINFFLELKAEKELQSLRLCRQTLQFIKLPWKSGLKTAAVFNFASRMARITLAISSSMTSLIIIIIIAFRREFPGGSCHVSRQRNDFIKLHRCVKSWKYALTFLRLDTLKRKNEFVIYYPTTINAFNGSKLIFFRYLWLITWFLLL